MARKAADGVNRSQAIRDVYKAKPDVSVKEVIETLAGKGIRVKPGLVYMIKGRLSTRKRGRRKGQKSAQKVAKVTAVSTNGDVLGTIKKVKALASEVGGLKKLQALVEVLVA